MPMMDGYELCRQIKDNADSSKTPVILMSGLGETHDQYWRKHAGADLYVAKSADASRLVKAVEDLLAGNVTDDAPSA
jgi:chemotaxis family two-component system response regulator PixH